MSKYYYLENARKSARISELDIRQAHSAAIQAGELDKATIIFDLIEPATKVADKLHEILTNAESLRKQKASRVGVDFTTKCPTDGCLLCAGHPDDCKFNPEYVPVGFIRSSFGTAAEEAAKIVASLSPKDIAYATSPERIAFGRDHRGFPALHDLCDANMLLPGAQDKTTDVSSAAYVAFCNEVMDEVTTQLLDR